jgi:hypothetical protein
VAKCSAAALGAETDFYTACILRVDPSVVQLILPSSCLKVRRLHGGVPSGMQKLSTQRHPRCTIGCAMNRCEACHRTWQALPVHLILGACRFVSMPCGCGESVRKRRHMRHVCSTLAAALGWLIPLAMG